MPKIKCCSINNKIINFTKCDLQLYNLFKKKQSVINI